MSNKVLIVDDAMFMRRVIRDVLEKGGLKEILDARNGDEAIECYKKERPGVVLLDITMPGKSGMEVLAELIRIDPDAKVVMCSAIGQEETRARAFGAGAVGFVAKPFQREKLLAEVMKYVKAEGNRDEKKI